MHSCLLYTYQNKGLLCQAPVGVTTITAVIKSYWGIVAAFGSALLPGTWFVRLVNRPLYTEVKNLKEDVVRIDAKLDSIVDVLIHKK
jgi:hypothetical protein